MDSVTQVLLGAATGEAVLGRKAGNKAVLWGAIAGTIPDLDVFIGYFADTVTKISIHRGFSHSFIFALLISPLLGLLVRKIHYRLEVRWQEWSFLIFMGIVTHFLLDGFTTWGTQMFWPAELRIALKSIFVIDPLYSVPLLICTGWIIVSKNVKKRQILNNTGLAISTTYLLIAMVNKQVANHTFEYALNQQSIDYNRYESRATPFNTILWTVNAETDEAYYTGYYSLFDEDRHIKFNRIPKDHHLIQPVIDHPKVKELISITNGWYSIKKNEKGWIFNDLRFGQINAWEGKEKDFVFSYNLIPIGRDKDYKLMIKERQQKVEDPKATIKELFKRASGEN